MFEPIHDLLTYNTIVKNLKSTRNKIITNCYLLPGGINYYAQQDRLSYLQINDGLLLFRDNQNFFSLYFFLFENTKALNSFPFSQLEKPVIVDLIFLETNPSQSLLRVEELYHEINFQTYKTYKHMSMEPRMRENLANYPAIIGLEQYQISFASLDDQYRIQEIWQNNLDIYSYPLPNSAEMHTILSSKQVFTIYEKDKTPIAALQLQQNGTTGIISHVVVDRNYRNRGLSKTLLRYCIQASCNLYRYHLWVEETNQPAINLYKSCGFVFDGRISHQLIKRV